MSTPASCDVEVAVIGAGVVGSAVALALARRGVQLTLLEAEGEPARGASGANSGILHTGFHSPPDELETQLIRGSLASRVPVLEALAIPVLRCGALMLPRDSAERAALASVAPLAERNGVAVRERDDGALEIPGEWVTDPVAYVFALLAEARRFDAELLERFRVVAIRTEPGALTVCAEDGRTVRCRVAVNCAGLEADTIARLVGDESFSIYPRKGEFLVFEAPAGPGLDRIILPVPSARTRGVLVFPTVDGKVVAGPTAIDLEDRRDWSVRPEAAEEIMPKALALYPELEGSAPIAAYAGLRPAGRGVNYLIGRSRACPLLVNVAAIRSTGLSASLGIADYVAGIIGEMGIRLGEEQQLGGGATAPPAVEWWSRASERPAFA